MASFIVLLALGLSIYSNPQRTQWKYAFLHIFFVANVGAWRTSLFKWHNIMTLIKRVRFCGWRKQGRWIILMEMFMTRVTEKCLQVSHVRIPLCVARMKREGNTFSILDVRVRSLLSDGDNDGYLPMPVWLHEAKPILGSDIIICQRNERKTTPSHWETHDNQNERKEKWERRIPAKKKMKTKARKEKMVRTRRRDETRRDPLSRHIVTMKQIVRVTLDAQWLSDFEHSEKETMPQQIDIALTAHCHGGVKSRQAPTWALNRAVCACQSPRFATTNRNTSRLSKIIYTNAVSVPAPGPNAHIYSSPAQQYCNRIDVPCLALLLQYSIPYDNRTNNNNNIACVCAERTQTHDIDFRQYLPTSVGKV